MEQGPYPLVPYRHITDIFGDIDYCNMSVRKYVTDIFVQYISKLYLNVFTYICDIISGTDNFN